MLKPICNQPQILHSYQHSTHNNNFHTQQKFNTSNCNAFADCLDDVMRPTQRDTVSQQMYGTDHNEYHHNNNFNLDHSYYVNNKCTFYNCNCCSNVPNQQNSLIYFSVQQSRCAFVDENITIETLFSTLETGINNNNNALLFAKLVSI
eukprot:820818_1